MPAITQCPHGHDIRSSADRSTQGACRQCKREDDRERRIRNRAALDVVKVFEAAGAVFHRNGDPLDAEDVARQLVAIYGTDRDLDVTITEA